MVETTTAEPPTTAVRVTRAEARQLEHEYLAGYTARFYELGAIPNPLDRGRLIPITPHAETESTYSERELIKQRLRDRPDAGDLADYPHNAYREISLIRRQGILGPRARRVVVAGAVWSPLDELIDSGAATSRAGRDVITDLIGRVVDDADTFVYLGILSTTGWGARALASIPSGPNYYVFLVDIDDSQGFRVQGAPGHHPMVRTVFDPESDETRVARVQRFLRETTPLRDPGGFYLCEEVAEVANVNELFAREACRQWARAEDALEYGQRNGTHYIRRRRYPS